MCVEGVYLYWTIKPKAKVLNIKWSKKYFRFRKVFKIWKCIFFITRFFAAKISVSHIAIKICRDSIRTANGWSLGERKWSAKALKKNETAKYICDYAVKIIVCEKIWTHKYTMHVIFFLIMKIFFTLWKWLLIGRDSIRLFIEWFIYLQVAWASIWIAPVDFPLNVRRCAACSWKNSAAQHVRGKISQTKKGHVAQIDSQSFAQIDSQSFNSHVHDTTKEFVQRAQDLTVRKILIYRTTRWVVRHSK